MTWHVLAHSQRTCSCLRLRSGTLSNLSTVLHCFCTLFGANFANTQQQTTWSVFRFHPQMCQDLTSPQLQPPASRMSGAQISSAALGIFALVLSRTPGVGGRGRSPLITLCYFSIFWGCNRLTQSIQNSGRLSLVWVSLPKQQWL